MNRPLLLSLVLMFLSTGISAQIGGINTYEFLNLSSSARISGLGGNLISVRDDDVNLAYANPSLLNDSMHQQLAFSHSFHVAGINFGYAAYGHHVDKWNTTFQVGIQYVNYGEFNRTNELGEIEGTFKASENAIVLGAAYPVYDRLAVGANVKFITSSFESYNSTGLATDVAAIYYDTASNFNATIVFKNIGTQLSTYSADNFEPLPFEIQVGISKRLRYLPFRFSIVYHHFDRWNILYDDPNQEEATLTFGEAPTEASESSIFFDNLFRHFIFGGEFLLGKKDNLRLRVGYNHFMRKELSLEDFRSLAGFSFGFGMKINRFRLDYANTTFHLGHAMHHLSIATNLREFKR